MITIKTGKLFVEKYNEENGTNLTPKDIFCMLADKAFRGGRHMVNWTNSKFFQYLKDYNKYLKGEKDEPSFEDALSAFCNDIENRNCGVETTLNVYGGCAEPSQGEMQTTEFNYCDNLHFSIDERYCSFIGSFFQICVGGFSTVLNTKDMVWLMYESFNKYYDYIQNDDSVRDKQLPSWNGCYLYQKLRNKGTEWINDHKRNGDSIETIDFIEFLDAITFGHGVNVKYLLFENFGQTNTTAGYVTLDLDGVKGVFNIIDRVLANIEDTFDLDKYSKIFLKKNLLRMSFESGEVTGEMVDPLYEFKRRKKDEEFKNKDGIKFLKEYLKLIMNDKEQELSKNFGEFIKNAPKKGKKTMSVKEETNDVLTSKNVTKFGNAVIDFCKKAGVDHTSGVPFDVVSYFIQDGNSSKLQEFLMYTKFNM